MSRRGYRNQSDIFNLKTNDAVSGYSKQQSKNRQMQDIRVGLDDLDRKKQLQMNQRVQERAKMQQKALEQRQEDQQKIEYDHKVKMRNKMDMMNQLEERRTTKAEKRRQQIEQDRQFMEKEKAMLERREMQRQQHFDRIKNRGNLTNMRQGHTESPAGVLGDPHHPQVPRGGPPSNFSGSQGMVFGEQETSYAQKKAKHKAYLDMLQGQIKEREQYKKQQSDIDKRSQRDALDQEMLMVRKTEEEKRIAENEKKRVYKQYLDNQISEKNLSQGKETLYQKTAMNAQQAGLDNRMGAGPNLLPDNPHKVGYGNIGKPGFENIGATRQGVPPVNQGAPAHQASSGNIMDDLYRGQGASETRTGAYQLTSPYAQPTMNPSVVQKDLNKTRHKVRSPYAVDEPGANKLSSKNLRDELPPTNMPYYSRDPNLPDKLEHFAKTSAYNQGYSGPGGHGIDMNYGPGGAGAGPGGVPPQVGNPGLGALPPQRQPLGNQVGYDNLNNVPAINPSLNNPLTAPGAQNEINKDLPLDLQNRQRQMNQELAQYNRQGGHGSNARFTGKSNQMVENNQDRQRMMNLSAKDSYDMIRQRNGNRGSYNILTGM